MPPRHRRPGATLPGVALRVLVVDNASAVALAELDGLSEVLRLPTRLSLGATRNAGLAAVRTELVAFADADDVFPAGYFRFLVDRLRARPSLVAVGCRPVALSDASGAEAPFPWPTDGAIAAAAAGTEERRVLAPA
jgi:glycosyltransferase involved in cell wall biosynthesis